MSIPDRLWRVVKGQWALANEKLAQTEAQADAYRELADTLRHSTPVIPPATRAEPTAGASPAATTQRDPLDACYALLLVAPGASMEQIEAAYQQRLSELHPEHYAAGTPERALQEGKREAITVAYEKLRDVLNPTETRFERLEF
jgi:DnaJ-domain-containing protein 1